MISRSLTTYRGCISFCSTTLAKISTVIWIYYVPSQNVARPYNGEPELKLKSCICFWADSPRLPHALWSGKAQDSLNEMLRTLWLITFVT